jgi:hypothetical protein
MSFSYRVIGRHWDNAAGSGANFSIYGVDCGGGGVGLAGTSWDNRISATTHGPCANIRHYAPGNHSGSYQNTNGGCTALRTLNATYNNTTSSISYFGPEDSGCSI